MKPGPAKNHSNKNTYSEIISTLNTICISNSRLKEAKSYKTITSTALYFFLYHTYSRFPFPKAKKLNIRRNIKCTAQVIFNAR